MSPGRINAEKAVEGRSVREDHERRQNIVASYRPEKILKRKQE